MLPLLRGRYDARSDMASGIAIALISAVIGAILGAYLQKSGWLHSRNPFVKTQDYTEV